GMQVPYSCLGDAYSHQIVVDNPNGYTLSYSLVCPQTSGGVNAPMFNACTDLIPGITIDSNTGEINFTTPFVYGSYAVGIQIDMFDGATFIGSVYEYMAVIARICVVTSTDFVPDGVETVGDYTTQVSANEVSVCAGDTLVVTVSAENSNIFRTINLTSDFTALYPTGTMTVSGINPAVATFELVTDESMIGSALITVDALDDACPTPDSDQTQFTLNILPSLAVDVLDTTVCFGASVTFNASGDTDFQWTPLQGPLQGQTFNGSSYTHLFEQPTQIEVVALNASTSCNWRDTIVVNTALYSFNAVITNESCAGNDGAIDITMSGDLGGLSFLWSPNGEVTEDLSGIAGGSYTLTATENTLLNCQRDTTIIIASTPPPSGSISGDITICEGECADILFTLGGVAPFQVELRDMNSGLLEGTGLLNDQDSWQVCPATTTTYTLESVTDANNPACVYTTPSSVTITVRPLVNAAFVQPAAICDGDQLSLEIDIDQPGIFELTYSPSGNPVSPVQVSDGDVITDTPAASGTYSVLGIQYTDAPLCPNLSQVDVSVTVNPLPTILTEASPSVCPGEQAVIDFGFTGSGNYSFVHDYALEASPVSLSAEPYTWTVAGPAVTTTITVSEVTDITTGCTALVNEAVAITVFDLPTATLAQDATVCSDESVDLTFSFTGVAPFIVTYDDGTTVDVIPMTNPQVLTKNPTGTTTYCITEVEDGNGCVATLNECVTLTEIPLSFVGFPSTSASICFGDCVDIIFLVTDAASLDVTFETPEGQFTQNFANGDIYTACPSANWYLNILSAVDPATGCNAEVVDPTFDVQVTPISTVSMPADIYFCGVPNCMDVEVQITDAVGPLSFEINGQLFDNIDPLVDVVNGIYTATVCPAVMAGFVTLTNYTDGGSTCTAIGNDVGFVTAVAEPHVYLDFDQTICLGEDVILSVTTTATSGIVDMELTIVDGSSTVVTPYSGVQNGDVFTFTPTTTTQYFASYVVDNTSPITCSSTATFITTVEVNEGVQISPIDTLCANNALSYQISFIITEGDPTSYSVSIPGTFTPVGAGVEFLSDPLDPSVATSVTVDDAFGCSPVSFTLDPFTCPIVTFAGTLDVTAQALCESDILTVTANGDEVLDADDVLSFVIHSNPGDPLGLVYAISNQPVWDVQTDLIGSGLLSYGVTYYVSAIAADDDGSGIVDLSAGYLSISEGTPFVIYQTPEALLSGSTTICAGESTDLVIDFIGTGPFTYSYGIIGNPGSVVTEGPESSSQVTVQVTPSANTQYELLTVSNPGCAGITGGVAIIDVSALPEVASISASTLCSGSPADLTLNFIGTAQWDFELSLDEDGDGNTDQTFTGSAATSPHVFPITLGGTFSVSSLEDATGCEATVLGASLLVDEIVPPTATFAFADSSFCSGSTVDVIIDLVGVANFTLDYGVNGGPTSTIVSSNQLTLPVNQSTLICLSTLTDNTGCASALNECLTLTELPLPAVDAGLDVDACSNVDAVLGSAGTPGLTYTWQPADYLDDATSPMPVFNHSNETPAAQQFTYILTVSDGTCINTDDVVVTLYPLPLVDAGDSSFVCSGGSVQLQASGAFDFLWTDNGYFPGGGLNTNNPVVTPALSTWFVVTGTDAFGCVNQDSVWVNVPDLFEFNVTATNEVCFQTCNGTADVEPLGGFSPYTIAWTNPAISGYSLVDLCAGFYEFTLTDSIGCTTSGDFEILERAEYFLDDVLVVDPTCFGIPNGSVEILSASAVEFELEGVVGGPVFAGLPDGNYTAIATDDLGCVADSSIALSWQSQEISITTTFDQLVICADEEVTFEANAQGGTGNFSYAWYETLPGASISVDNPFITTPTDTLGLFVIATDDLGCISDTLFTETVFNTPVEISVENDTFVICENECIDLVAFPAGGSGPILVEWTEISPQTQSLTFNSVFNVCPDVPGAVYVVTANDNCAPLVSDTVYVTVNPLPVPEVIADVTSGCFPVSVVLTNLTNSDDLVDCQWFTGDGFSVNVCGDLNYTYANPGEYAPFITVTDINGCTNSDTVDETIIAYGYPTAGFTWQPSPVSTIDNEVQFVNTSDGAITYTWNFGFLETSIEENPEFTFPPLDLLQVDVCLIATNQFGCNDTICANILVESELLIYVPNAFTPDNDGMNDVFYPVIGGGIAQEDYRFQIWDRWGDLVYESTVIGQYWNGSVRNGSYYSPNDVYIWVVEYKRLDTGEIERQRGHVTLLR
ncbi:MAG: hypothetical protein RL226_1694, partial [Bacteroidota bacterium]